MIHSILILSLFYRILKYFLFLEHYYHYKIYAIILISPRRTSGPSNCLFFVIPTIIVVHKTGKTKTIHDCCLIIPHTPSTIRANVDSL